MGGTRAQLTVNKLMSLPGHRLFSNGSAEYLDLDNDGWNNWQEYLSGTNPTYASSLFKITSAQAVSGPQLVMR
jgi:hypothetical protein